MHKRNFSEDITKMIEKQVKFLYGKYYDKCITNQIIFIEKNNIGTGIEFDSDILFNIPLSNNMNIVDYVKNNDSLPKEANDYVKNVEKKNNYSGWSATNFLTEFFMYYKQEKKTILKINLHDGPHVLPKDGFYIGHNRYNSHDTRNPLLIPLFWHHDYYKCVNLLKEDRTFYSKNNKLIFRGATNGSVGFPPTPYLHTIRHQIISTNFNKYDGIDVGFSNLSPHHIEKDKVYVKDKMKECDIWKNKFILCIGGNDRSSMFPRVLAFSNCCPLHPYPFDFTDYIFGMGLEPYVHFVPVKSDGSDLKKQFDWCLANLDKCKNIADNGSKYMEFYSDYEIYKKIIKRYWELYPQVKYCD